MPPKRGPSAYFVFSEDNRSVVREELTSKAVEGTKISVALVAKELGKRWKALTEKEQAAYKQRAQEAAAALQQELEAHPAAGGEGGEFSEGQQEQEAPGLPTSTIRRIMLLDEEVKRVAPDAVKLVARAAELFMEASAERAAQHAASSKRKTVKFADVLAAARADRRWDAMGMRHQLQSSAAFEAARGGPSGKAAGGGEGGRKKEEAVAVGMQPITNFFHK